MGRVKSLNDEIDRVMAERVKTQEQRMTHGEESSIRSRGRGFEAIVAENR